MPKFVSRFFSTCALTLLVATACREATAPTFAGPPPLPEEESITPEIAFWTEFEGTAFQSNFGAALQAVLAGHQATTANSPFVIALLNGAQEEEPESQSDGYHWIYTVTDPQIVADVNMRARARGNVDAVWEMRVSSTTTNPALTSFKLMEGITDLRDPKGTWRIFSAASTTTQVPILDVSWFNDNPGEWRVVYVNITVGSANNGDYIDFQRSVNLRRLEYFDKSANTRTYVDWDADDFSGKIMSPSYNNNVPSCWNAARQNVACP